MIGLDCCSILSLAFLLAYNISRVNEMTPRRRGVTSVSTEAYL
jgi:hypothetical protein